MATPSTFIDVAWYKLGSHPGEAGSAVMAGHVNNALTKAGVFEHLSDLNIGDGISITDANGAVLHYAVRDIEDYPNASAPLSTIFSTTGPSQLVLITCAGDWDPKAHTYDHRVVIFAGLLAH
jgi:LPXTG-site transpeptidase (sortase) family protein